MIIKFIQRINNEYRMRKFYISDNDEFFDSEIFKDFRIKLERIIYESYNEFDEEFEFEILDKLYELRDFYNFMRDLDILDDIQYRIIIHYIDNSFIKLYSSEYFDL